MKTPGFTTEEIKNRLLGKTNRVCVIDVGGKKHYVHGAILSDDNVTLTLLCSQIPQEERA
jgi:hypothetical protein